MTEKKELDTEGSPGDGFQSMLDHIENCPAVFQSQQIGDPELTKAEKREIASNMLHDKPVDFLIKFGKFLEEVHLNDILKKHEASYEVQFYVDSLKRCLGQRGRNRVKRNRRYEAMKRLEANTNYFSDVEMEKREPLLYHQMVGQYLNKKEKEKKHRQAHENLIPTFSNYLLDRVEKEELKELLAMQQKEEDLYQRIETDEAMMKKKKTSMTVSAEETRPMRKWGADWEDEKDEGRGDEAENHVRVPAQVLESGEKALLSQEFKSIMQNRFLSGQDEDFNYSEVDSNSDYDCLEIRGQDEEERYFDDEACDHDYTSTDTGIEDY